MSYEDFMQDDPYDEKGSGRSTIAHVKIEAVWSAGWGKTRDSRYFPFVTDRNQSGAKYEARQKCLEYIKENKITTTTGKEAFPNLGFLTSIPIKTNLLAEDWLTWDIIDFVNCAESAKKQMGSKGQLDQEQQEKVSGKLPYDLVLESLDRSPHIFEKFVWARLEQMDNQVTEAKGIKNVKDGKEYTLRLYVVTEVFASEEEARKVAMVDGKEDDPFSSFGGVDDVSGLSAKATDPPGEWTLESLKSQAPTIEVMIKSAMEGNNPEDRGLTRLGAEDFICEQLGLELSDLNLIVHGRVHEDGTPISEDDIPL